MSWFQKLLPPKIKRKAEGNKKNVPEGLWHKCINCEAVLYHADLEKNLEVCPSAASTIVFRRVNAWIYFSTRKGVLKSVRK